MTRLYEGMFVLDNQLVREDWKNAKSVVTNALEKHGGKIHTARRWDERRLAYPIKKRRRGTYLLSYFELPGDSLPPLARDLELSESVLRHLILQAEIVPETEVELTQAESADDFAIPAPPEDDAFEEEEQQEAEASDRRRGRGDRDRDRGRDDDASDDADEGDDEQATDDGDEAKAESKKEAATEKAEATGPAKES